MIENQKKNPTKYSKCNAIYRKLFENCTKLNSS